MIKKYFKDKKNQKSKPTIKLKTKIMEGHDCGFKSMKLILICFHRLPAMTMRQTSVLRITSEDTTVHGFRSSKSMLCEVFEK